MHLVAQDGVRYSRQKRRVYIDSIVRGFLNVREGYSHHLVAHLVYASSSSVYGGDTKMPFVETEAVDHPISLYAATKRANELNAHTYSHLYGLPTTGLHFFTLYGPWGNLTKLLDNEAVTSYIGRNEPEILNHLELVVNTVSMEEPVQQQQEAEP